MERERAWWPSNKIKKKKKKKEEANKSFE